MKKILLGFLIYVVIYSIANADSLDFSLMSFHFDDTYDYNESNFGIGYTKEFNNKVAGKIGSYNNSYDKNSIYALIGIKQSFGSLSFGLNAGFVTGYDNISGKAQYREVSRTTTYGHHYKYVDTVIIENKPKNLNKYQFMILPTVSYTFHKKHRFELGFIPSQTADAVDVVTLQYQIIL